MAYTTTTGFAGTSIVTRLSALRDTMRTRRAQRRVYRTTLNELQSLSRRELNDMGLNAYALESIAYEAAYGPK